MALQIEKPYIHVEDANGNPFVGAHLYVYLPTTTTLAPVFTDDGLSIAATNPATSDAAGNFPRIYIAAGTYKLRAETSAGVLIWEEDNIDTGLSAGTGALPISRGGTGATTAAAARSNLDVPSNSELTILSTQVASLQSSISTLSALPQGRLTPSSGVPVPTADVTSSAAVYYTPYSGNLIPIWNGTSMVITPFAELTLALVSNHVASAIYDCFVISDSGAVRLVTGPAWNSATAGSSSRGTGAGTSELSYTAGPLTNANAMTARYGATTVAVAANAGTYVGSIFIDSVAGQVTCHRSYGQNRKFGVWNAYNRVPICLKIGDSTATWGLAAATTRASNNAPASYAGASFNVGSGTTCNGASAFMGLAEESVSAENRQRVNARTDTNMLISVGVGINAINAFSGLVQAVNNYAADSSVVRSSPSAKYILAPFLGLNVFVAVEANSTTTSSTFSGTEANFLMTVEYRG